MLSTTGHWAGVFAETYVPEEFDGTILKLCSSQIDVQDQHAAFTALQNCYQYGLTVKECYTKLAKILEDAPVENIAYIFTNAGSFLTPVYHKKLVDKFSSSLKHSASAFACQGAFNLEPHMVTELMNTIKIESELKVLLKLMHSMPNCRSLLDAAIERSIELMMNTPKSLLEFVVEFELLSRMHSSLSEALERAVLQSSHQSEVHLALLVCLFARADERCYGLWDSVLRQFKEGLGKMALACGTLLCRMDGAMAQRFKYFILSFIESKPVSDQFSLFIALFMASNRQVSRADIVGELLMLAAESGNAKFIQYLNMILEVPSDAAALSINDFKMVLDHVDLVPSTLILDFYMVIVKIALRLSNGPHDPVVNELSLIVRKQLASANDQVCLNGVAGALAMSTAKIAGASDVFDFEAASCSQPAVRKTNGVSLNASLMKEFMLLAYSASLRFVQVGTFFFRSAIEAVRNDLISSEILEVLNEKLANDFQSTFVTDTEADIPEDGEIKFNLMDDAELVVTRIYPVLTSASSSSATVLLPLHLRLLAMLEKKLNGGNLENIDAILKFPLVLPAASVDGQLGFSAYLIALNLLREMVNVFSDQSDVQIKESIRKRLLHIVEIEHELTGMAKKIGPFNGLRLTPFGPLLHLDCIQVMQQASKAHGKGALEILGKVSAYCNDMVGGAIPDARAGAVKLKSEEDIFRLLIPLEPSVLQWLGHGLDVGAKGKDDDLLSEDEFLCLLIELRAQLRAEVNLDRLLPCLDSALHTITQTIESLQENSESELCGRLPGLLLDLARTLRERQALNPTRAQTFRSIFGRLSCNEEHSIQSLKFKIVLADEQKHQQEIMDQLVEELNSGEEWSAYAPLMDDLKTFTVDRLPLYAALESRRADTPQNVPITKTLLEMTIAELQRSSALEQDEWVMTRLEALAQSIKSNYSSEGVELLLKHSKEAIDMTISRVIPRFERVLKDDKDRVLAALKRFQQYTRTIQAFCNHIKAIKDKTLLKRVPPLKRSLEASLLRVKQMLQANNCHGAFWVGNLKHKGLDGKEVESQIPLKREETVEDDEEMDDSIPSSEEEDEEMKSADAVSETEDPTLALSV